MATTFTSATLNGSYDDDYDVDKHFHQILFNSGRALQARELTQLQTMIYQEIGRFGRNIFKEGAAVSSGGMSINSSYEFLKVASTNSGGEFSDIPVGTIFEDAGTLVRVKVLQVVRRNTAAGFTNDTLYVQYIDDGEQAIAGTTTRFADGVTLLDRSGGGYELVLEESNATGRACRFDVATGDFFVLGRFVNASKQTIILNNYAQSFTGTVGFKVTQEVVNIGDDTSLYDNTGGITNTAAPGADRYRISLTLIDKADTTADDTFLFLANIENSKIVEKVDEADAYNKINDVLAQRTNEESGDYVVEPFSIHYEDAVAGDENLELIISSGSAYVNGYRVNNPSPIKLSVPRPTSTETFVNDVVPIEYGNYFLSDSGQGIASLDYEVFNITKESLPAANSKPAFGSSDIIGTCRVRSVEKINSSGTPQIDGSTHKVFVFDVKVNDGEDLGTATAIGTSATEFYSLSRNSVEGGGSNTRLFNTANNDLLMPLSRPRLQSLASGSILLTVQRKSAPITAASNQIDISAEITDLTNPSFVNKSLWIVSSAQNSYETFTNAENLNGVITGLTDGVDYEVYYYVQYEGQVRSKTLSDETATLSRIDSEGVSYYKLDHYDIYDVDSVRNTNSTGIDMLGSITLDDGQRDNFYQRGRLIVDTIDSAPAQVYVAYSRFQHAVTGDFFAASSYPTDLAYGDIPTHVNKRGQEISLFNYLDFRSPKDDQDLNDNGTFATNTINRLPRTGDNITADISYYLPRADKLILTQEGEMQLLMGQQSVNPQFRSTPENAIDLYKIQMNPNTIDETDLTWSAIEHPHYTMKDIAQLEAKVDRLEEYTKLSIAELNARLDRALDSDGVERTEIATISDDASDQTRTDTNNDDHSSSIDPEGQVILPECNENNVNLIIDSDASAGVVRKGDNVYLAYSEEEWAFQELASTSTEVNPFGNATNFASLKISPSSDDWKESYERATRVIEGNNRLDVKQAQLWNNWQWNWQGRSVDESEPAPKTGGYFGIQCGSGSQAASGYTYGSQEKYSTSETVYNRPTSSPKHVSRVVASDTLRKRYGNRYVDAALVPWIRSRKVYFHAKGLKPMTKMNPFFDGVDMSDWVKQETFVKWSDRTDGDIGNQYGYYRLTEHPDGKSELISDENGELQGSLFIPSIRERRKMGLFGKRFRRVDGTLGLRFRAGIREFMLLDIDTPDWEQAGSKCFNYYSVLGFALNLLRWRWLRYPHSTVPYSYLSKRAPVYSAKEIKDRLDKISSSGVNIIDPQLAGQYGSETTPLTNANLSTIDDNNTMSTVVSDYITVNQNQQASSTVAPTNARENPLAQTFYVDNPYGLVLTKVELFFEDKDDGDLPVSIQIRPMENGKPSEDIIVPDSQVFVNPASVTTTSGSPTLSEVQGRGTDFVFEEPVYLQPWQHYAIVIQSNSTKYKVYTAKTQQPVLGSTARSVTTQPIPGSLFLPQNGTTWQESKDQDLMYRLTRAKFDGGNGSLILTNGDVPNMEIGDDRLYTSTNTNALVVVRKDHGFEVGDQVTISGAEAFNGVTANEINTTHSVGYANAAGFLIRNIGTVTSTGLGGGDEVSITTNNIFTTGNLQLEHSLPRSCSLDTSVKTTSGNMVSGNQTRFVIDEQYSRITPYQNIDFGTARGCFTPSIETSQLGGARSLNFKIDFKSGNDYVSPIVDLQRTSFITAGFHIDNPDVRIPPVDLDSVAPIVVVPETQPTGNSTASRYIQAPVTLPMPAVGIDAKAMVSVPDSAGIDFYYRTCGADEDLWVQPWVKQEPVEELPKRNTTEFTMTEFLPGGQNGTLKPFYKAQVKYVMTGTSKPPVIKEIRTKFLAD